MHSIFFVYLLNRTFKMEKQSNKTIDLYIRNTWLQISKMYNEKAAKHNSTMVTGFALLSIDPKLGTPSTQLGPKMGIEPTSVSRTINKLEKKGFILKKPNPEDGRSTLICLTPLGREKREITKTFVLEFNQKIEEDISPEELDIFLKVAKRIKYLSIEER